MQIIGVDVGRYSVKVFQQHGYFSFPSKLGEWRELEFTDEKGKDDIIGEYRGRQFLTGTLVRESDFGSSLMTANKLHEDTVILTLIAIAKAFDSSHVGLVTNLPIIDHAKGKAKLKRMLEGYHEITINGEKKRFNVRGEIAPEGSGIYKYSSSGIIHGLNIGSRTVNAITFQDGQKIGRLSDTFEFGMETQKNNNIQGMAHEIAARIGAMKWLENEPIYLCGGGALTVKHELMRYYPNIQVTNNPIYTDAEAFYLIAKEVFRNG